jgi:MSHA biogenesis protein MshP
MSRFQRGFTLIAAIVILVVFAGLAAAISLLSTTQMIGAAQDVQGARAYQAARAGIEWGLFQITPKTPGGAYGACFAPTSFSFPAVATSLQGFTVRVTCATPAVSFGGPTVYVIDAIACNRGSCPGTPSTTYVERSLRVTL